MQKLRQHKPVEVEMKFFIIHGSYGNPQENWFPWLKQELEKLGHNVFVPKFPTPEGQNLETWMSEFEDTGYFSKIDGESVFIGHSLGPAFILSVLERLNMQKPIKACFFVAGFLGLLNNPEVDGINETFVEKVFNWSKIKKSCKNFFMYASEDDPYVPIEKARELKEKLGAELKIVRNAGHFNEKAGYKKFKLLLEDIKRIL